MFSVDPTYNAMRDLGASERGVVERTETTYWPFCKLVQQTLSLYKKAMPHLTSRLPAGALSTFKWNTFYLNYFGFASFYNSLLTGYYPTAGSALRTIMESFVRLRYFEGVAANAIEGEILLHYQNDRAYRQAHSIASTFRSHGALWYDHYTFLCNFVHSGLGSVQAIGDIAAGRLPDTVQYNLTTLKWMIDKSVPLLHVHIKALAMILLGSATVPLRKAEFDEVIAELTQVSGGTALEAMINQLCPGTLPADAATSAPGGAVPALPITDR